MSDLHASIPVVEALIFSAGSPIGLAQLKRVLPDLSSTQLKSIIGEINGALEKEDRPYEIAEVAGGYQFRTRPEFAEQIRAMQPERKLRLSRAALETLSVIAYRQPITRAEIEELRCVDCGAVVKGLLERGLERIMGGRDGPGRPVLYGTSASFLESLRTCISRLPPKQRTIIEADLRSGDVAEAGQLAQDLSTTKNSIYASRSIARKTLRKALGELGYFVEGSDHRRIVGDR